MRAWMGVWALVAAAAWPAFGQATAIRDLARVVVPASPDSAERETAALLAKELGDVYGARLAVDAGGKAEGPCIVLGRGAGLAGGLVTSAELEAVKHDGYLIRSRGAQVVIAGYGPQGTTYGAHEFLRRVGIRRYPWHTGGQLRVVEVPPGGVMPELDVASKPFFEYRHMLGHLDRGPFGGTIDAYGLGDFRAYQQHEYFKDKGWLGSDHTAPFLVPMAVYHEKHPEYYAMLSDGKRLPKTTQNCRVALCLSNPDVHRIASGRALEWMAEQKTRRFFYVTDGDTGECVCPACLALDPAPPACTDRYLAWVNSVARPAKDRFPDNVCLALAYGASTLPPVNVKPEANAIVMYCPWYWNSRATSAVTWASPLNITAMKEFMAWNMRFPGRMGLYDYPGDWVSGQAGRIKFLAKEGARFFHGCGGGEELYHWVNSRLLWDPFQDSEALRDEFVRAFYGPAAGPVGEYLALRERLIASRFVRSMTWLDDPEFFAKTRELMAAAARLAAEGAPDVRVRVGDAIQAAMLEVLRQTSPGTSQQALRSSPEVYASDLRLYTDAARGNAAYWRERRNRHAERQTAAAFEKGLESLGLGKAAKPGEAAKEEGAEVFDRAADGLGERVQALAAQALAAAAPSVATFCFDGEDEAGRWILDGTEAKLLSAPEAAAPKQAGGDGPRGVRLCAPFSKLPVIEARRQRIHAGRFYAERVFSPAFDAGSGHLLLLRLHASHDVPVTLYLDRFHVDFNLHAGEQIVRVDLRNLAPRWKHEEWDRQVKSVAMDIWPQDGVAPSAPARDTEIVMISMTFTNRAPEGEALPYAGKAAWLAQFRANLPHAYLLPQDQDRYTQRQRFKHRGGDRGVKWIGERFRTFTPDRALSPVFAILADDREAASAQELRGWIRALCGVDLPVHPPGQSAGPGTGNAILLGKDVCLAAGLVSEMELAHAGPRGFVVNACQGRVAIAGASPEGTRQGALRYLEDHGMSFAPGRPIGAPRPGPLHELYLVDGPWFETALAPDGGEPRGRGDRAAAAALVEAIKDLARRGQRALPRDLAERAALGANLRHVARKALWNPFADTSALLRECAWE